MPALIRIVLVVAAVATSPAAALAQGSICVSIRCLSEYEDDGPSAADLEAQAAAREADFERRLAEVRERGAAAQQESVRRHNDRGIAAAQKKDWRAAISHFEAALLLDPTDAVSARNLEDARARERHELRARQVAVGPAGSSSSAVAVEIATRMPTELTPARPDARSYLTMVRDFFVAEATAAASDELEGITVAGGGGLIVRLGYNMAKLAREVPDQLMKAATGEISPDDASLLTEKNAAMVLNLGAAPGKYLEKLVEVRSARVVALGIAEEKATALVDDGILWLAERAGASGALASKPLELGKKHSERIWKWVRPASSR